MIIIQQPLTPNNESGSGFGSAPLPGGQLLSAALGVTRAVTQFLGAALQVNKLNIHNIETVQTHIYSLAYLQGAGRTIQTAWSTQGLGSASGNAGFYRLSGR